MAPKSIYFNNIIQYRLYKSAVYKQYRHVENYGFFFSVQGKCQLR